MKQNFASGNINQQFIIKRRQEYPPQNEKVLTKKESIWQKVTKFSFLFSLVTVTSLLLLKLSVTSLLEK